MPVFEPRISLGASLRANRASLPVRWLGAGSERTARPVRRLLPRGQSGGRVLGRSLPGQPMWRRGSTGNGEEPHGGRGGGPRSGDALQSRDYPRRTDFRAPADLGVDPRSYDAGVGVSPTLDRVARNPHAPETSTFPGRGASLGSLRADCLMGGAARKVTFPGPKSQLSHPARAIIASCPGPMQGVTGRVRA